MSLVWGQLARRLKVNNFVEQQAALDSEQSNDEDRSGSHNRGTDVDVQWHNERERERKMNIQKTVRIRGSGGIKRGEKVLCGSSLCSLFPSVNVKRVTLQQGVVWKVHTKQTVRKGQMHSGWSCESKICTVQGSHWSGYDQGRPGNVSQQFSALYVYTETF